MEKRVRKFNNSDCKKPYFYVIQHMLSGRYYAGYSANKKVCNSSLLMTQYGYKTSSKEIHEIIENEGLDSFIVRRIRHFNSKELAIRYESRFLKAVNAAQNKAFLNMSNGHAKFYLSTEANERRKLSSIGRKHSPETIMKMKSVKRSNEFKEKISNALKGKPKPESLKQKLRGRKFSDEHKQKLSNSWKTRKFSESELRNRAAARVGCKWWNDGSNNRFCKVSPGNSWIPGMIFKPRKKSN